MRKKSNIHRAGAVLLPYLLSENIWRCFGLTCYKDPTEQCFQDCEGCDRYIPHCSCCEASDGDLYSDDGEIFCDKCLIERYSQRDGRNLYYEFLRDYSDEYKQYVLDYFEDFKVGDGDG